MAVAFQVAICTCNHPQGDHISNRARLAGTLRYGRCLIAGCPCRDFEEESVMDVIARKQAAVAAGWEVYGRMLDLDDAHIEDAVRVGMGAVFEACEQQHAGAVDRIEAALDMLQNRQGSDGVIVLGAYAANEVLNILTLDGGR